VFCRHFAHHDAFFKSMTTHADHRIWQDVYHSSTSDGKPVYLKLTVIEDVLIVSFKEL
jgi:motility quorum-sensing regulator / GCU-specific mRNA interferase toxin